MADDRDDLEDEEFEDELDDEDVSDPDEDDSPRSKKQKRMTARDFLDVEADVDEDEEEEDLDDEDMAGEGQMALAAAKEIEEKGDRASHRSMNNIFASEQDVEKIAQRFESQHYDSDENEDDDLDGTNVPRPPPSVKDPKIWIIRCKPGKERNTVVALMRKFIDSQSKDPLLITSALAPQQLKGFIYVEAFKEAHVTAAIKGIRTLQERSLKLVPLKEMPDILNTTKKEALAHKGDWVRIKRGMYKGDLAQVIEVDETRSRVTVKLIPRLDLSKFSEKEDSSDGKRKAKKPRMPPRFFNYEEVERLVDSSLIKRITDSRGESYTFGGNTFLNGYLLKVMDMRSLDTHDVMPSIEEVKKFQEKNEKEEEIGLEDSLTGLAASVKQQRKTTFVKGDTVVITEGELKHLMGVVESVEKDVVNIRPKLKELEKELVPIPATQLRKYFKKGDHVKVIGGKFEGETGLILQVEESSNSVCIFSDLTNQEIKVFLHDIQECTDVSSGHIKLGNYELHDLVQINQQSVGVIVKIERDQFKILDNSNNIQTVALTAIGPKRNTPKYSSSFDSCQNRISVGDVVNVVDGPFKGKQGTIKHIYRMFVFLHSREVFDNSGIFVVRTSHIEVLGSKKANFADPYNPVVGQRLPPMSPGPRQTAMRSPVRGGPAGPRKENKDDNLKSKTVFITKGQWKGYMGMVKETTTTTVRVELHTNSKMVTVPRDSVRVQGESEPGQQYSTDSLYPPQTPVWGSRTPMRDDPSRTPLRNVPGTPSRTPGTPGPWDPNANRTPAYDTDYSASYYGNAISPAPSHFDTPADSSMNPTTPSLYTPGAYEQRTPIDSTPYPHTPVTPAGPTTPRGPLTPAMDYGESTPSISSTWLLPGVEVRYNGETGVVTETFDYNCRIMVDSTKALVVVTPDQLDPVPPEKNSSVIVTAGELKGQTGTLASFIKDSAVFKSDTNPSDIKMLPIQILAKHRKNYR